MKRGKKMKEKLRKRGRLGKQIKNNNNTWMEREED